MYKSSNLSLSFWNIGGRSEDKLKDKDFRKHLTADIICFTESFTNEKSKLNLAGFVSDQVIRSKQHENSKRPSGGVVVYIKSRIAERTEVIRSEHDDLSWIKLKKSFFDIQNDLYIGVVYIIPSNSSSLNHMSDAYDFRKRDKPLFSIRKCADWRRF